MWRSPRRWGRRWSRSPVSTAATSPARGASISPTGDGCSPRPTRRRRRSSSRPRPPGCAGSPRPTPSPCRRCWRSATTQPNLLVLDWIDEGRRASTADGEARFGRQLAALHRAGAPAFGRADRRTTGSRGLPNEPCATWAEFYAHAAPAPPRSACPRRARAARPRSTLETLAGRLDEFAAADEAPARLHGDLWAGNRLVDAAGDELADRSCRPRRPPRVRPGDDAPVRRLRRRVLRRLRGVVPARRRLDASGSPCTRSPRSSCTPSSSAADTSPPPNGPSAPTPDPAPVPRSDVHAIGAWDSGDR